MPARTGRAAVLRTMRCPRTACCQTANADRADENRCRCASRTPIAAGTRSVYATSGRIRVTPRARSGSGSLRACVAGCPVSTPSTIRAWATSDGDPRDERLDAVEGDHAAQPVGELDGHVMPVQIRAGPVDRVRLDLPLRHVVEGRIGAHRDRGRVRRASACGRSAGRRRRRRRGSCRPDCGRGSPSGSRAHGRAAQPVHHLAAHRARAAEQVPRQLDVPGARAARASTSTTPAARAVGTRRCTTSR